MPVGVVPTSRGIPATWVSAVGGDADPVALGVGEDAETGARDVLDRLDDGAAQAFCLRKRLGHILDGDEEQHLVLSAPVSMKV